MSTIGPSKFAREMSARFRALFMRLRIASGKRRKFFDSFSLIPATHTALELPGRRERGRARWLTVSRATTARIGRLWELSRWILPARLREAQFWETACACKGTQRTRGFLFVPWPRAGFSAGLPRQPGTQRC